MRSRLVLGWRSRGGGILDSAGTAATAMKPKLLRLLVSKVPNRAAVHGLKRPVNHKIINEEVEKEMEKAKQEKQTKREEVEKTVDSLLDRPDKIFPPS